MKIRYQRALKVPVETDAETVIIFDDFDQPIAVVQHITDGHIWVVTAEDPEFRVALKQVGYEDAIPSVREIDENNRWTNIG